MKAQMNLDNRPETCYFEMEEKLSTIVVIHDKVFFQIFY